MSPSSVSQGQSSDSGGVLIGVMLLNVLPSEWGACGSPLSKNELSIIVK